MDFYRLNLNLLIALDILLQEHSVTLAAKKLFITQAAMSNNLQQLRAIFNDQLLVRNKNKMTLTTFAKELHPKLHLVLQEMQSLIINGQRFVPQSSERIFRIGITDYMASLLLPKLIPLLQQQAPKIKITIISTYHLSDGELCENGEYEIGVGKLIDEGAGMEKELLFQDKIVVLLNKKHPLAYKKNLTIEDYVTAKHIAVRVDPLRFPTVIEQALEKLGARRNITVAIPYINPIFKMVEESTELIASVTEYVALLYQKNHEYVIKKLPFQMDPIDFFIVWHQRSTNDPGHQWLREQIRKVCKSLLPNQKITAKQRL